MMHLRESPRVVLPTTSVREPWDVPSTILCYISGEHYLARSSFATDSHQNWLRPLAMSAITFLPVVSAGSREAHARGRLWSSGDGQAFTNGSWPVGRPPA
jgi:hypothetical protein